MRHQSFEHVVLALQVVMPRILRRMGAARHCGCYCFCARGGGGGSARGRGGGCAGPHFEQDLLLTRGMLLLQSKGKTCASMKRGARNIWFVEIDEKCDMAYPR